MERYTFWRLVAIDLCTIIPFLVAFVVAIFLIFKAFKCILRSEMLRTYYHNEEKKEIRQYELENFILLYKAYKVLHGNSFIDKIHKEVLSWKITT